VWGEAAAQEGWEGLAPPLRWISFHRLGLFFEAF